MTQQKKIVKYVLQSELMITSWTYVTLAYVEKIIRQQQQITLAMRSLAYSDHSKLILADTT